MLVLGSLSLFLTPSPPTTNLPFVFCVKCFSLIKIKVTYQLVSPEPYTQPQVFSGSKSLEAAFKFWLSLTPSLLG